MKILFSGGITLGPVTPLIAVAREISKLHPHVELVWVGTKNGIEQDLIKNAGLSFYSIPAAKLRRYISWRNITDIFVFFAALCASAVLLIRQRPNVLVSAGSSVSVPLHWVARLFGIPTLIHQQDIFPGLANRLMKSTATRVTVACDASLPYFPTEKTECIGNPVREELAMGTVEGAQQLFNLEPGVPVVLIMGGGTGSLQINRFVEKSFEYLTRFCQIIHVTGKDKEGVPTNGKKMARYHAYEFLDKELPAAFAAAGLVVCRAGFSTISELSFLGKAALLIPIPHSHQEQNADYVEHHGAAHVVRRDARAKHFSDAIEHIVLHPEIQEDLEKKMRALLPRGATTRMVEIIDEMV